jgi:hypothetical protein
MFDVGLRLMFLVPLGAISSRRERTIHPGVIHWMWIALFSESASPNSAGWGFGGCFRGRRHGWGESMKIRDQHVAVVYPAGITLLQAPSDIQEWSVWHCQILKLEDVEMKRAGHIG